MPKDLRHIDPERLSHAYVIESSHETGLAFVRELMATIQLATRANPDYHEYVHDVFRLEHAHALRHEQSMHGADGGKKIFVITFNTITRETENALLKTLEEPTRGTHFFFVVRSAAILLPTVRSRMQTITLERVEAEDADDALSARKFLASDKGVRMKMLEPITKAKADDKSEAKEEARAFLRALEYELYAALTRGEKVADALADVVFAQKELSGRAPGLKLLLDTIALLTPQLTFAEEE